MIKFIAVVKRMEGLSFDDFQKLWCGEHPELVLAMPGVRAYQQNLAHDGTKRDWPIDGIAEVTFDDSAAMKAAFASPEGKIANKHQELFAGDVRWFMATEHNYEVAR